MATKLELANHMLATIGERAQVSLDTGHPSMIQAISILESCNADFQARGWWFNTEKEITLVQNNIGEIILPAETTEFALSGKTAASVGSEDKGRYVQRGNRVYDRYVHTYTFTSGLRADLTLRLPIEELPEPAASYLKHLAAETMYADDDGDEAKSARLEKRKIVAWGALQIAQLKAAPTNAFDGQFHQQLRYRMNNDGYGNNPVRAVTMANPAPTVTPGGTNEGGYVPDYGPF